MKLCEYCEKEIKVVFASGRFCDIRCARGYSTQDKRQFINEKVSKKLSKPHIIFEKSCGECKNLFVTKKITQKFCCRSCAGRSNIKKATIAYKNIPTEVRSVYMSDQYKRGRVVSGGKTKWVPVLTTNGLIKVQGTYEVRTCKILDNWIKLEKIKEWEYTRDRFTYYDQEGKEHRYLVDFKITNHDDSFYYIEVKGFERPTDKLKWEAVTKAGFKLEVWFNFSLQQYEKEFYIKNGIMV